MFAHHVRLQIFRAYGAPNPNGFRLFSPAQPPLASLARTINAGLIEKILSGFLENSAALTHEIIFALSRLPIITAPARQTLQSAGR